MSTASAPISAYTLRPSLADLARSARRARGPTLLCLACAALLVPWAAYLATSLPQTYVTANWNVAWVGFDLVMTALLVATGVLAHRRHPLHAPIAFATAAFLVADAWFDIVTSTGTDLVISLASAALVELPLATLLVRGATRATTVRGDAERTATGAARWPRTRRYGPRWPRGHAMMGTWQSATSSAATWSRAAPTP
jgi:hypothetical protein